MKYKTGIIYGRYFAILTRVVALWQVNSYKNQQAGQLHNAYLKIKGFAYLVNQRGDNNLHSALLPRPFHLLPPSLFLNFVPRTGVGLAANRTFAPGTGATVPGTGELIITCGYGRPPKRTLVLHQKESGVGVGLAHTKTKAQLTHNPCLLSICTCWMCVGILALVN